MGKDYNHTYEAKCRQGIEEWNNAPLNLKRKWNRDNFHTNEFKVERLKIKEIEQDKIMKEDIINYNTNES